MVTEVSQLLHPQQQSTTQSPWRWYILLSFSLFSFSSALMWVTFAPCLYIFIDYYFHHASPLTTNAIHSLASVYMFLYPLVIHFTFPIFDDTIISKTNTDNSTCAHVVPGSGLKRGIMIGAVLNLIGAAIRWCGGSSPTLHGFLFLFIGQTLAALAQVFMLAIPPQLAVSWFSESEINFATAIAVSANNFGIAVGCLWSPRAIKQATVLQDVPRLLFCQFLLCLLVLITVWSAFQKQPPYKTHKSAALPGDHSHKEISPANKLFKERNFKYLLIAYGVIFGAQCSIITLIDQVLLPPFTGIISEGDVGLLSCATLSIGVPGSVLVGRYLDNTKKYRHVCNILSLFTSLSLIALYLSIEYKYIMGVVISCIVFGTSSYSIAPAIFQYCGELFYPINEIIPTGYLFLVGNISGVIMVNFMGWTENANENFNMRYPLLCLLATVVLGTLAMTRVHGVLKRSSANTVA